MTKATSLHGKKIAKEESRDTKTNAQQIIFPLCLIILSFPKQNKTKIIFQLTSLMCSKFKFIPTQNDHILLVIFWYSIHC